MRDSCINVTSILLLNLWCVVFAAKYGRQINCVVANFQFQRNFDMTRYPDFVYHKLSANPNSTRSGISFVTRLNTYTVASRTSYRDPKTGECTTGLFVCKNVARGSPAINVTQINVNELNSDGTCKSPDLFVESMNPVLRRRDARLAKRLARKYCINPSNLFNIAEREICPEARKLRDEDARRNRLGCRLEF